MKIRQVNGKLAKMPGPSLNTINYIFFGWHCGCGFYFNNRLPLAFSVDAEPFNGQMP